MTTVRYHGPLHNVLRDIDPFCSTFNRNWSKLNIMTLAEAIQYYASSFDFSGDNSSF